MEFKQHASSDFVCTIVKGTPHCGKDENTGHFRYCVDIVYTSPAALDANRFLLDNLDFQTYFDGLHDIEVSCEQLAIDACRHFEEKLGDRIRFVSYIDVKIYPFGEVFVEADDEPAREYGMPK
jgi:hypothetical protein